MKNILFLLITATLMTSGCISQRIKLNKDFTPPDKAKTLVVAFANEQVLSDRVWKGTRKHYWTYHDSDVVSKEKRQKVADIVFRNNWNQVDYTQIFSDVEESAQNLGGNYLVLDKHVLKRNPWFRHKIKARLFYLNDLQPYELGFNWSSERDISREDYHLIRNPDSLSLKSGLKNDSRLESGTKGHYLGIRLVNRFIRKDNHCNNCSDLEILKENLKFDLIELYQRKITQKATQLKKIDFLTLDFFYPHVDHLKLMLKEVQQIKDEKQIRQLIKETNQAILQLERYKNKLIIQR